MDAGPQTNTMTRNRLLQRLHNGEIDSVLGDLVDHCGSHPSHADGHHSLGLLLERLRNPRCPGLFGTLPDARSPTRACVGGPGLTADPHRPGAPRSPTRASGTSSERRTAHPAHRQVPAQPGSLQVAELLRQGRAKTKPITDRLVPFGRVAGRRPGAEPSATRQNPGWRPSSTAQRRLVTMLMTSPSSNRPPNSYLQRSPRPVSSGTALGPALLRSSRQ